MSEKWAVMWGKKAFRMERERERESGSATKCCSKGSTVGGLCTAEMGKASLSPLALLAVAWAEKSSSKNHCRQWWKGPRVRSPSQPPRKRPSLSLRRPQPPPSSCQRTGGGKGKLEDRCILYPERERRGGRSWGNIWITSIGGVEDGKLAEECGGQEEVDRRGGSGGGTVRGNPEGVDFGGGLASSSC